MAEQSSNETFLSPSRRSYVYESSRGSGNKKRVLFIIVGVFILIGLVAFAVIATGGKGESELEITPTPTQTEIPTPTDMPIPTIREEEDDTTPTPTGKTTPTVTGKTTPTPTGTSSLDRENLKIIVQNGGGVAGAATKGSDFLKELGYTIVSSGNADDFDYEETEIKVKSTKKAYLDQLKKDLSEDYTVGTATSDYTGTDADAVVIIGKE